MTPLPDSKSIPPVNEHVEAYQNAVNIRREEATASFLPEEVSRMRVLESVSKQLEDAKIPFALWGNPLNRETGVSFWRFNRLDYLPEDTSFKDRADEMMRILFWRLAPTIAEWTNAGVVKYSAFYDENRKLLYAYDNAGARSVIVLPEDAVQ